MKQAFRIYRRKGVYYCQDNETGKQESLRTSDKGEAHRLVHAKNEARVMSNANRRIACAYMAAADPEMPKRTWREVVQSIIRQKTGPTRKRWETVEKDKALAGLWKQTVVATTPEQFLYALEKGTTSTNVYLRRLHNYALDVGWLSCAILPRKRWPKVIYAEKRAITREEHEKIIAREKNPERRDYYELLWYLGGAQTDVALLQAEDVDWKDHTVFYRRKKNGQNTLQHFGNETAAVVARRPKIGLLFPYLASVREADRATEFKQRCTGLGIRGITLHSYRYGWAERAAASGYPERHAQSGLGHGSKAVARAYARKAKVKIPALEDYEKANQESHRKIVPFTAEVEAQSQPLPVEQ